MRLLNLILFILISLPSVIAQDIPRKIDLKVDMISPEPYSVVQSPTIIEFTFRIVNQGPDTLVKEDSILYRPTHSYRFDSDKSFRFFRLNKSIIPGDSFDVSDTIHVNYHEDNYKFQLWFSYVPSAISWFANRPIQSEFIEQKKDNRASVTLIHLGSTASDKLLRSFNELSVFPNPLNENSILSVNSPFLIEKVEILSDLGQTVKSAEIRSQSEFQVDLVGIKPGSYVIALNTGDIILRRKIIIL